MNNSIRTRIAIIIRLKMLPFCVVQAKILLREHIVAEAKFAKEKKAEDNMMKVDGIFNQILSVNASLEVSFPIYRYSH